MSTNTSGPSVATASARFASSLARRMSPTRTGSATSSSIVRRSRSTTIVWTAAIDGTMTPERHERWQHELHEELARLVQPGQPGKWHRWERLAAAREDRGELESRNDDDHEERQQAGRDEGAAAAAHLSQLFAQPGGGLTAAERHTAPRTTSRNSISRVGRSGRHS